MQDSLTRSRSRDGWRQRPSPLSQCNDACNGVEVGFDRALARSDLVSLIRFKPVQSQAVFLRIDSYGAKAELIRGAKNPDGDLAAIGGEQFSNGFVLLHPWPARSLRETLHCFMQIRGDWSTFFDSRDKQSRCTRWDASSKQACGIRRQTEDSEITVWPVR